MRLFWNTKYDFIKLGRPALIFSAILLIAALIFIIVRDAPSASYSSNQKGWGKLMVSLRLS